MSRNRTKFYVKIFAAKAEVRPSLHYAGEIWKRKFHSENASNGFRTRKRIKCFPSTLRRGNLKTQQSQAAETLECTREHALRKVLVEPTWRNQHGNHHFGRHFGFVFEEDSGGQIAWLLWRHRFQKAPFLKFLPSTLKRKAPFSNSSVFTSVFVKLRFRFDNFTGLVWTEGLAGEIKLRFQIPPA